MATVETFKVIVGKVTIGKDPDDELDYTLDFAEWLESCDDTIALVDVDYTGVTEAYQPTHDDTSVTVWVTGGEAGQVASARVRITTVGTGANPRQKDQTIYFKIKER